MSENFKQLMDKHTKLIETFRVVERIATIAVNRLGGTLRIKDDEWLGAEGADMQWRTVRMPGLEPEIHVAVTLQGEDIAVSGRDIANLRDEAGGGNDKPN